MTTPNVALVTGGSTGIGWEICRQMLDAGYEVVSLARRKPPQSHPKLHAVEVDLMDADATGPVPDGCGVKLGDFALVAGQGEPDLVGACKVTIRPERIDIEPPEGYEVG